MATALQKYNIIFREKFLQKKTLYKPTRQCTMACNARQYGTTKVKPTLKCCASKLYVLPMLKDFIILDFGTGFLDPVS